MSRSSLNIRSGKHKDKEIIKFDKYSIDSLSFSLSAKQLCVQLQHNTARGIVDSSDVQSRVQHTLSFVGLDSS